LSFDYNPGINWKNYFLSKVHYGATARNRIKKLHYLLKKLENDKPKVTVDLGQIACFHKSLLFELEKEIRLLFDDRVYDTGINKFRMNYRTRKGTISSPIIRTDIYKSCALKKEVRYLELPIYYNGIEAKFVNPGPVPIPKIERIIFGYSHTNNFSSLAEKVGNLCQEQLGYLPKIEKSRLTKYYHDVAYS
jgi:hypothetical protein